MREAVSVSVVDEGAEVHLEMTLPEPLVAALVPPVTGSDLTRVRLVDADFEEPDGSPLVLDTDLVGNRKERGASYPLGPLAVPAEGSARIRVW